jgi:hypothetical protein
MHDGAFVRAAHNPAPVWASAMLSRCATCSVLYSSEKIDFFDLLDK